MQNRNNLDIMAFFVSHFLLIFIGYFKQALKRDWLFCFSVPFSLSGEKVLFRANKVLFGINNDEINACALIGQSAMFYCASKLMENSRVF